MPWWQQRVYLEGLETDEVLEYREVTVDPTLDPLGANLESFEDMGLRVIRGG
jgi:hypothetical protein